MDGIAAAQYGDGMTRRIPLLLLPGLLCDARLWRDQIAALNDIADATVADLTQDDSIPAVAARALAAVPARDFVLAGLSMGGYVAFEILRRAGTRVRGAMFFDTSAQPDTPEQSRRRRGLMALSKRGQFRGVTPRLLPMLLHPDRADEQPLAGEVMEMADRVGHAAFLRQQTAIMNRCDSRPDLPGLRMPVLVAAGRQDALTPLEKAEEIAAGLPDARLAVIEDAGHLPTMERPAEVSALMRDFLLSL